MSVGSRGFTLLSLFLYAYSLESELDLTLLRLMPL